MTIEADLAEQLRRRSREREMSFKAVLNDALRRGLSEEGDRPTAPFVQSTSSMGLRAGIDIVKANQIADQTQDSELIRKLEQRR